MSTFRADTESDLPAIPRERLLVAFGVAVAASLVLPRIPWGLTVLYPFALLSTWAHEMGHGLAGELVGGRFERLVLMRNLGGYALVARDGGAESVFVSAAGLLGPAVAGAAMIWMSARERIARYALAALSVLILISVLVWVRGAFGFFSMLAIGVVLAAIAFKAPTIVRVVVAGFIGVQFCLASWSGRDYMFTKNFQRDGETLNSDTQNIAEEWFLPYWFWGGLVLAISLAIMAFAFWRAWIRPLLHHDSAHATVY